MIDKLPVTSIYAQTFIVLVTAVTFLEYWKRKNASLAHHWDTLEYEEEEVTSLILYSRSASANTT